MLVQCGVALHREGLAAAEAERVAIASGGVGAGQDVASTDDLAQRPHLFHAALGIGRHAVSPVRWVGVRRGSSALRALPQSHMERCFVNGTMVGQRPSSDRSEEHTSELQPLMRISYAVFCLKKKKTTIHLATTKRKK